MKKATKLLQFCLWVTLLFVLTCTNLSVTLGATPAERFGKDRLEKIAAMLPEKPRGFGVPITDRGTWQHLNGIKSFKQVIGQAERLNKEPIPDQPDDLYLDFSRTGNRTRWQRVSGRRRGRISDLALAECLENKGRFIPAFEDIIREICSERTWVMPAHDRSLTNFKGTSVDIDLGSSMLAWSIATADYLLADRLSPEVRELIRTNLEQRIFTPYTDMVLGKREVNWWMKTTNNWNAVCLGGVTGSALATIESRQSRALFVYAAEDYSKNFLKGFTNDGYCSEGLGYWNYGFGYYVTLSEAISQATNGKIDLLGVLKARQAATFGAKIEIQNGVYPAFADCSITTRPSTRLMYFVSRRLGMGLSAWDRIDTVSPAGSLYDSMMYSFPNSASRSEPAQSSDGGPGLRTWFNDGGVLICRPAEGSSCRLAGALKGGHNAEHHNHNDVGSFIVVLGDKPLLIDPGSEVYTARTFSSKRYESNVLNSFGHPVPVIAGKLQRTGLAARARILSTSFTDASDSISLDIASAYDVPQLEKLHRTFTYSRKDDGSLIVKDEVAFKEPCEFGLALITFDSWKKISDSTLIVYDRNDALRIDIDVPDSSIEIKSEIIKEDLSTRKDPTRLGINLTKPVKNATVTITITPANGGNAP